MSATKLSRIAGSVFVLAAVLGGAGAAAMGAGHEAGGSKIIEATWTSSTVLPAGRSGAYPYDVIWL